jgi:hypothetical protein
MNSSDFLDRCANNRTLWAKSQFIPSFYFHGLLSFGYVGPFPANVVDGIQPKVGSPCAV